MVVPFLFYWEESKRWGLWERQQTPYGRKRMKRKLWASRFAESLACLSLSLQGHVQKCFIFTTAGLTYISAGVSCARALQIITKLYTQCHEIHGCYMGVVESSSLFLRALKRHKDIFILIVTQDLP